MNTQTIATDRARNHVAVWQQWKAIEQQINLMPATKTDSENSLSSKRRLATFKAYTRSNMCDWNPTTTRFMLTDDLPAQGMRLDMDGDLYDWAAQDRENRVQLTGTYTDTSIWQDYSQSCSDVKPMHFNLLNHDDLDKPYDHEMAALTAKSHVVDSDEPFARAPLPEQAAVTLSVKGQADRYAHCNQPYAVRLAALRNLYRRTTDTNDRAAITAIATAMKERYPQPPAPTQSVTQVVNKHTAAYDVYIGRGSVWGNPFIIGTDGSRVEVIAKYEAMLRQNEGLLSQLHTLTGKRLGCFCKPYTCHGDVLIKLMTERGLDAAG